MGSSPLALKDLRDNLFSLLANTQTATQLNEVVALCHAIAAASLKHAVVDGSANQEYLGLRRTDIAYDCIADLFRKDEAGNFVQLQSYFKSLPTSGLSEQELLAHLRRIVQSKTQQGLFRIYQESDPTLGKILRNIKISIQVVRNFQETERFHEVQITPIQCDPLDECTTIDVDGLVREFGPMVRGSENIPEMLSKLAIFLRAQTTHRRSVPLISAALAFRALYARGLQSDHAAEPTVEAKLMRDDARRTVHSVCEEVKQGTRRKYLQTKKIEEGMFDAYFTAIEHHVFEFVMGVDGHDAALFQSLQKVMPGLTSREFQKRHRNTIEYLARLCRTKVRKRLQEELL